MRYSTLATLFAVSSLAVASPTSHNRSKKRACNARQQQFNQNLAQVSPSPTLITHTLAPAQTLPAGVVIEPIIAVVEKVAPSLVISPISVALPSSILAAPATRPALRSDKHVFAHFMVGIVSTYTASAWEYDMSLAKAAGISGFALNIGVDPYNEAQLDLAYAAGEKIGFDLFISFDFNWFTQNDYDKVTALLKRYASRKSQLLVDGKVFVSTFIGDGFDWSRVAAGVGKELYAVPFYQPKTEYADRKDIQGLFSWAAWPGQLDNQPVKHNMTLDRDDAYMTELTKAGKTYMAPVSPWFSTHFGKEVPYSKNWVFYSELLWKTRWDQILAMGDKLNFIEIVTWNDYGESHHIGPYNTGHSDDGSSKWNDGMDHTAMLDMAVPYITAFRAGLTQPVITQDMVVYWYRPHLKSATCDSTDNCGSKPTGWEMLDDSVFVTVLSQNGGTVTVTSGNNPASVHHVPAGSHAFAVPMGVGKQNFKFQATGGATKEGTSTVDISDKCWNGIYNFNFHAGSVKL